MSTREDARLAAEIVTRQARFAPWFVFALPARDEAEGFVVHLYTRVRIKLTNERVRDVLVKPILHEPHPGAEALTKAILAGARRSR